MKSSQNKGRSQEEIDAEIAEGNRLNSSNSSEGTSKSVEIYEKNAEHIFRNAEGHFVEDTVTNRNLLIETTSN